MTSYFWGPAGGGAGWTQERCGALRGQGVFRRSPGHQRGRQRAGAEEHSQNRGRSVRRRQVPAWAKRKSSAWKEGLEAWPSSRGGQEDEGLALALGDRAVPEALAPAPTSQMLAEPEKLKDSQVPSSVASVPKAPEVF